MIYLPLILAVAFAYVCDILDIRATVLGIKKGLAVEQFTLFVGQRPSALALFLRDSLFILAVTGVAVLISLVNVPLYYGSLAGPVVLGIRHLGGARKWNNLLNGGKLPDPNRNLSAWQKFWQW